MKRSEKEELLKYIEAGEFPVSFPNYKGMVINTQMLERYISNLPTDKEEIKEIYAIRDVLTDDVIWNSRGSAYKELADVEKKIKKLKCMAQYKDKDYEIITFKLVE